MNVSVDFSTLEDLGQTLKSRSRNLDKWLFQSALPLWFERGLDRKRGGFAEALDHQGLDTLQPRRGRLAPRMIYVFAEAGRAGWEGPWQQAMLHGFDYLKLHLQHPDGYYLALVGVDGDVIDGSFDLYNQAFVLLALASIAAELPDYRNEALGRALELIELLQSKYKHPVSGFECSSLSKAEIPLCSNPHMHMFEAMLAWEVVDPSGPWPKVADEIAELALSSFIIGDSGIGEFFDRKWAPFQGEEGKRREPGHQFEWAWLLHRWALRRNRYDVIETCKTLYSFARTHGLQEGSGAVVMALDEQGNVTDALARLWGQTEWLKAALILAGETKYKTNRAFVKDAIKSIDALYIYLDFKVTGLWSDKLLSKGEIVEEPVPASSLYHIICAINELRDFVDFERIQQLNKTES